MVLRMKEMAVREAKRFGVITCHATESLMAVADTMRQHHIGALIVVDAAGDLAGVITRADLVRACYERPDWATQPVCDYRSAEVVTVLLDDPMSKVMGLLVDRRIHCVVAVEPHGERLKPVAVLSAADVVYHMANSR